MVDHIPGAHFTAIKGAGCFPIIEDQPKFNQFLLPVLTEIRTKANARSAKQMEFDKFDNMGFAKSLSRRRFNTPHQTGAVPEIPNCLWCPQTTLRR
jgi:hypothetical protein